MRSQVMSLLNLFKNYCMRSKSVTPFTQLVVRDNFDVDIFYWKHVVNIFEHNLEYILHQCSGGHPLVLPIQKYLLRKFDSLTKIRHFPACTLVSCRPPMHQSFRTMWIINWSTHLQYAVCILWGLDYHAVADRTPRHPEPGSVEVDHRPPPYHRIWRSYAT